MKVASILAGLYVAGFSSYVLIQVYEARNVPRQASAQVAVTRPLQRSVPRISDGEMTHDLTYRYMGKLPLTVDRNEERIS